MLPMNAVFVPPFLIDITDSTNNVTRRGAAGYLNCKLDCRSRRNRSTWADGLRNAPRRVVLIAELHSGRVVASSTRKRGNVNRRVPFGVPEASPSRLDGAENTSPFDPLCHLTVSSRCRSSQSAET